MAAPEPSEEPYSDEDEAPAESSRAPLALAFLAVLVAAACSPAAPSATSGTATGGDARDPVTATTTAAGTGAGTAIATAPATTTATPSPPRAAMTPLGSLARLVIVQGPGGPFKPRCGAIETELSIDLKTNAFTWLTCEPKPGDPEGKAPLRPFKQGKLTAEQRKTIDEAYNGLTHGPAKGCGTDGGTLRLELAHPDGRRESYVDDRWGCGQPPPEAIEGLSDFTSKVFAQVTTRAR